MTLDLPGMLKEEKNVGHADVVGRLASVTFVIKEASSRLLAWGALSFGSTTESEVVGNGGYWELPLSRDSSSERARQLENGRDKVLSLVATECRAIGLGALHWRHDPGRLRCL